MTKKTHVPFKFASQFNMKRRVTSGVCPLCLLACGCQSYKLLGILDVQNTPCAREAVLHGAGGSVAAGLLHFLATSEF